MPETNVAESPVVESQIPAQTPVIPTIVPTVEQQAPAKESDLITKVAQFKKSQAKAPESIINSPEQPEFESIKDPIAKEAAKQAVERMRRGMQSTYERQIFDAKQLVEQTKNWTPERLQRELNNPSFLSSAQQIAGNQNQSNSGLTDEQFSALTPQEKGQIDALRSKINTLEQSNFQATVAQRDSQLQTRYPDYNPTQIDATIRDLAQMNPLDIREHVYKSLKHDEDVAAGYRMGLEEGRNLTQTKINAITPNGNSILSSDDKPIRDKNDTDQTYFMKLATHNLAKFKNRK